MKSKIAYDLVGEIELEDSDADESDDEFGSQFSDDDEVWPEKVVVGGSCGLSRNVVDCVGEYPWLRLRECGTIVDVWTGCVLVVIMSFVIYKLWPGAGCAQ